MFWLFVLLLKKTYMQSVQILWIAQIFVIMHNMSPMPVFLLKLALVQTNFQPILW